MWLCFENRKVRSDQEWRTVGVGTRAHNWLLQGSSVVRSKSRPCRDQASFQQDGGLHMPGVYFLSTLSSSWADRALCSLDQCPRGSVHIVFCRCSVNGPREGSSSLPCWPGVVRLLCLREGRRWGEEALGMGPRVRCRESLCEQPAGSSLKPVMRVCTHSANIWVPTRIKL